MLQKLLKELQLIRYKVKFINEILNDTIDLRKKKKQVIQQLLKDKQYPKLSNQQDKKSYDYLIKLPMDTLTHEKVQELNNILTIKQNEYNLIEQTTEKQMWMNDLVAFESVYKKDFIEVDKKNMILLAKKIKAKSKTKPKAKKKK